MRKDTLYSMDIPEGLKNLIKKTTSNEDWNIILEFLTTTYKDELRQKLAENWCVYHHNPNRAGQVDTTDYEVDGKKIILGSIAIWLQ